MEGAVATSDNMAEQAAQLSADPATAAADTRTALDCDLSHLDSTHDRAQGSSPRCTPKSADLAATIDNQTMKVVSNVNWGLDMLVKVGEAWAADLLSMTACASRLL